MTGKRNKSSRPEGFSVETRYVVLSFLGRVPTSDSLSSSMGSSRSVPSDGSRSPTKSVGSATSGNGTLSKQALRKLPDINMVDKYHESQMDRETNQMFDHHIEAVQEADGATKRTSPPKKDGAVKATLSPRPSSIPLPTRSVSKLSKLQGKAADKISRLPVTTAHSLMVATTDTKGQSGKTGNWNQQATRTLESAVAVLESMDEGRGESKDVPQCHVPVQRRECSDSGTLDAAEQSESESLSTTGENSPSITCSLRSFTSSTSVLDLLPGEVEVLVKRNALPPLALPLKEELTEELHQLEQLMPLPRAMTPQSEVAYYLAQIGDRVQEQYSNQLSETTGRIMELPRKQVTYCIYQQIAEELISASSGWTRVALVLLLSQKLAFGMLSRGERNLGELAEYTAHLIEDTAADFIVESGGWNAVRDIATTPDMMPLLTFTSNLAGVDEHDHLDSIDEVEDTPSQTDSAICTDFTPDTSTAVQPQLRDISMDSISSSVWDDMALPGDTTSSAPQLPRDTGGTNADSVTSKTRDGATGKTPDGATRCDVRDDIHLLRQMSSELSREADERRQNNYRWRRVQIILLSTFTAIVAAYVAYKKLHH